MEGNYMEGKFKRSFPFEKNCVINNKIKKIKVHTNQMPNNMEKVSQHNFIKHSKVQSSEEDRKLDKEHVSLVEKMMPTNAAAYVGQKQILGPGTVLGYLLEKGEISSMIFWGPPGCGKTSLTNVIACLSKEIAGDNVHIVKLSANNSGVKNIRDAVITAKNKSRFGCKTIVFMDDIHCFNKLQQDIFLPHVEAGTFTLIGCTTENPSYSLNPALLSRCRVFVLNKLTECDITEILHKAIDYINGTKLNTQEKTEMNRKQLQSHSNLKFCIDNDTIQWLVEACDGDARVALNTLELAVLAKKTDRLKTCNNNIILKDIKENLIKAHVLSEKETSQSHHMYSALHKSIRAGKANASLYWMARIMAVKEDPVNIARRLVRISSEDIGLADPDALGVAVDTMYGCQMIGMPECDVLLGQCAVYLAKAPKSRSVYNALKAAENIILKYKDSQPAVPLHKRHIDCLPTELQHINFFQEKEHINI
ncbi:ATPase WRNIP1-like isoform X2 [Cataglyphis hispanica]|uniref:ATPase WRNIP1-like isoform X2 n=1 Tax=Cataglyphis hispanica TaxID=1086592 RepID=UPI0021804CC7|nr:ATPase WRNIP1-like isoform X2 [Cataglyphis hispanica]XP_050458369.1 ATPase WRNIP1-like isoform X2 [Cataglyphis hispanica]